PNARVGAASTSARDRRVDRPDRRATRRVAASDVPKPPAGGDDDLDGSRDVEPAGADDEVIARRIPRVPVVEALGDLGADRVLRLEAAGGLLGTDPRRLGGAGDAILGTAGQEHVQRAGPVGEDHGAVAPEDHTAVLGRLEHVAGVLLYELVVRGVEQRPEAAVVEHPGAAAERAEDAAHQTVVGVL